MIDSRCRRARASAAERGRVAVSQEWVITYGICKGAASGRGQSRDISRRTSTQRPQTDVPGLLRGSGSPSSLVAG